MLSRVLCGVGNVGHVISKHLRRNIGISAVAMQKANLDPIQQMFLDKIREYASKSKSAGGKLVDATPEVDVALKNELDKISRQYGAEGKDMTQFPTFTWTDPDLEPVSVKAEITSTEEIVEEDVDDSTKDVPYFDL